MTDMFEKVRALLADQLKIEESAILPESRIKEDLGADSLDVLQILLTIEERYGIVIPDEELAAFDKVSDVAAYMERRG